MKIKIFFVLVFFVLFPIILFARSLTIERETYGEREEYIDQYLNTLSKEYPVEEKESPVKTKPTLNPQERISVIEKTLRKLDIELSLEYIFSVHGKQSYEKVDEQGRKISRLVFPHRGGMWFLKGEMRFLPRLSIGGKYGNSNFRKTTNTDTDWLPSISPDVWWESNSDCNGKIEIYDVNLYFRLLNLDAEELDVNSAKTALLKSWMADKLSLDIFAGYQREKNRYSMFNLVDTVEDWESVNIPYKGQDCFYKVTYQGPRLGLRAEGSHNRFTCKLSFAYTWLKTAADGWWNLRKFHFRRSGENGRGLEFQSEITYKFSPHLSGGLGYYYIFAKQRNMKETRSYEPGQGIGYTDLVCVKNTESKIYGPTAILKYIW